MIWIGRLRRLQGMNFAEGGEETQAMEGIFRRLVGLSKQYMPGYIDAFQEGYVADWDQYIIDAQEQFRLAVDASQPRPRAEGARARSRPSASWSGSGSRRPPAATPSATSGP